jgi:PE family
MSYLFAVPGALASAAKDLEGIGSALKESNRAAAAPTTGALAPAADGVSAAVASAIAGHAQDYQALSAQISAFHQQFVQSLTASAGSYAAGEAANATLLESAE